MTNPNALVQASEVVEFLSLREVCRICGSSADWVIELIEEGILEPTGESRPRWRFESTTITTIRRVQRLQSDLRLNIAGVAVVLSLADENAALKRQLQLLENDTRFPIPMSGPSL